MRVGARTFLVVGVVATGCAWLVRWRRPSRPEQAGAANVTDEARIAAPPEVVCEAIVDEHDGKTEWRSPYCSMELVHGGTYAAPGALLANTVRVHGKCPIRFMTKTVEVEPAREIRVEVTAGAFRGEATWSFEGVDGGTMLRQHWRTRPARVRGVLAPLLPVSKSHSDTMEVGCERLSAHREGRRPSPAGPQHGV